MTADPSVKSQKLKPGTLKRIFSYGKPYSVQIAIFLFTVVIEALLIISTPLLLREIIDKGVKIGRKSIKKGFGVKLRIAEDAAL